MCYVGRNNGHSISFLIHFRKISLNNPECRTWKESVRFFIGERFMFVKRWRDLTVWNNFEKVTIASSFCHSSARCTQDCCIRSGERPFLDRSLVTSNMMEKRLFSCVSRSLTIGDSYACSLNEYGTNCESDRSRKSTCDSSEWFMSVNGGVC